MNETLINGKRIAYTDDGDGEPIVFLHCGFIADSNLPLVDAPELGGYRRVHYHRRGYSRSGPATPPVSLAEQAGDLVALMDELNIERAHLVGHSLGGLIATETVRREPHRVASLSLLEATFGFLMSPASLGYLMSSIGQAFELFGAGEVEAAVSAWLTAAFSGPYRDALEAALPGAYAQSIRDGVTVFTVEAPSMQAWDATAADLQSVACPTFILTQANPVLPGFQEMHDGLLRLIPGAEGVQIPQTNHMLHMLTPRPVAAALAAFLQRQRVNALQGTF